MKKALVIERKTDLIYLTFSDGVRLKWTSDSLMIFITLDVHYSKKVNGLCGNYNKEGLNDLILPDQMPTLDPISFGNSWKIDSSVKSLNSRLIMKKGLFFF